MSQKIQPLSPDELDAFLQTFSPTSLSEHRTYILSLLILDTGLRIREVIKLTLGDVDRLDMSEKMRRVMADYLAGCRHWLAGGSDCTTLFLPTQPGATYASKMRGQFLTAKHVHRAIRGKMRQAGIATVRGSARRLRQTYLAQRSCNR